MKIRAIRTRAVAAPMKRPLATSIATISVAPLLLLDLETDAGIVGRSYLFGPGKHHLPPIAELVKAMAAMLEGDEVAPFDLERKLRARYTLLGVHNIVLFAMAGIDMAAWDALGQSLGQRLQDGLTNPPDRVRDEFHALIGIELANRLEESFVADRDELTEIEPVPLVLLHIGDHEPEVRGHEPLGGGFVTFLREAGESPLFGRIGDQWELLDVVEVLVECC